MFQAKKSAGSAGVSQAQRTLGRGNTSLDLGTRADPRAISIFRHTPLTLDTTTGNDIRIHTASLWLRGTTASSSPNASRAIDIPLAVRV